MLKTLRNIIVVGVSTVGSRILGLTRDILIFAGLGTGIWNDAFILALTLPNLFRRLLGEGALASAMTPVFSDVLKHSGRAKAFAFLNEVIKRLSIVLLILTLGGMLCLKLSANNNLFSERWLLGAELAVLLFPYMIFICLAAVISAGLNLLGRFAAAASTSMLLNISIIGTLIVAMWLGKDPSQTVYWLCGGVLFGGFLQLAVPSIDLMGQGWRPALKTQASTEIQELWNLFLPGLAGAVVVHVNTIISRLLAYSLDESAVSMLYLASRLMELPLGIFTISVAIVFFPLMARAMSDQDNAAFANAFTQSMRLVVGISLPAGVGLIVLGEPILYLLFRWGAFSAHDVAQTFPLVVVYGLGLPFYSVATIATRGLHACKDMKSPVRVAGLCLLVNVISGIILMQFYGAVGLALGNVLAAVVQSVSLWRILSGNRSDLAEIPLRSSFFKIAGAGIIMGAFCFLGNLAMLSFDLGDKLYAAITVCVFVPAGVVLYFGVLYLLRFEELDMLKEHVRRFISKRKSPE